jgi:hypothetical protein
VIRGVMNLVRPSDADGGKKDKSLTPSHEDYASASSILRYELREVRFCKTHSLTADYMLSR